ncbi:MAG: helix-turn-helix domain-containing protein [Actinomycetota bacterium]|nr:helix-turn-helix domain-containing protein [Actinomycetota bacterium]
MTYRGAVPNSQTLGRILQQARLARGLTQQQVAEELGISQRYVWELEAGKPSLVMTRLFAFMRLTGMTLQAEIPEDADEA